MGALKRSGLHSEIIGKYWKKSSLAVVNMDTNSGEGCEPTRKEEGTLDEIMGDYRLRHGEAAHLKIKKLFDSVRHGY